MWDLLLPYLKNFLLPLQIQMGKVDSKLGKVLKSVCTAVLICATGLSCLQSGATHFKAKAVLATDSESGDTIIFSPERSRGRLIFDYVKKIAFIPQFLPISFISVLVADLLPEAAPQLRYAKHVFYIYAISEVP